MVPSAHSGFRRLAASSPQGGGLDRDNRSYPADWSKLFDLDPAMDSQLGPLSSFRCTRFGIVCNGARPSNQTASGPLAGCVSNDGLSTSGTTAAQKEFNRRHSLVPSTLYTDYLRTLKPQGRLDILLIGGPTTPFRTAEATNIMPQSTPDGVIGLQHTCSNTMEGAFADPPVRLAQVVSSLGGTVAADICSDFGGALQAFGRNVASKL